MRTWVRRYQGTGLKTRLLHPHDEYWDRRLGVRTFGYLPAVCEPGHADWQGHYQPTSYRDLFKMLRQARLGSKDVYVDLGCGLGRTVFAAAFLGARRAIGVEINGPLVRACNDNLARSRVAARGVRFDEAPAQAFAHLDTTVLFMFHPFGRGTLRSVIDGLRVAYQAAPRPLRLVYFNAVSDDILADSGFLRRVDRWEPGVHWQPTTGGYPASFWEA
jgi:SAM-dependent methyltransferase